MMTRLSPPASRGGRGHRPGGGGGGQRDPLLTRQGFTAAEALDAWAAVGRLALGAAADAIRLEAVTAAGRPPSAEWHRVLASRPADELPGARAVAAAPQQDPHQMLDDELTTLLVGIAVRRGERWEPFVHG